MAFLFLVGAAILMLLWFAAVGFGDLDATARCGHVIGALTLAFTLGIVLAIIHTSDKALGWTVVGFGVIWFVGIWLAVRRLHPVQAFAPDETFGVELYQKDAYDHDHAHHLPTIL